MSSPHRWSRHTPADASSPGHWTAGPSAYESPRGGSGRSSLAYAYKTSENTTWTIRHGQTAEYVFRSRTTRQTDWSSVEPGMETRGSLRIEQPETPRNHDHRKIRDSYRIVPGPPHHASQSSEYSRPRSSNRKHRQGVYNSKPSRPQGQRSHSYSNGEESDHKSRHKSSRSQYSDDRSRKNEYEPDTNIRSSRGDGDYGRSNKHESGRTSNQNHYNGDSGRSRKYEPDYKAGSRHHNEDNSRSNKYKTEPRYEKARPKISSTIEEEEEELPNYYAMLGISPFASRDEVRRAAKSKRVEVHPDKCVKPDMSEIETEKAYEVAAAVGQAADVLTDAELRWWYDKKVAHRW